MKLSSQWNIFHTALKNTFFSLAAPVRENIIIPLKIKIPIFAPPCKILHALATEFWSSKACHNCLVVFHWKLFNSMYFNFKLSLKRIIEVNFPFLFTAVRRAVDQAPYINRGGKRLDLALQAAYDTFYKNEPTYIQRVLVVITGGPPNRRRAYAIKRMASRFIRKGVQVYAVGVGRAFRSELRSIAYKNKHVYYMKTFGSLLARANQIAGAICSEQVRLVKSVTRSSFKRCFKTFEQISSQRVCLTMQALPWTVIKITYKLGGNNYCI